MTCPNCKCLECRVASHEAMKAALGKIVSRETISPEQHNKAVLSNIEEREQWSDIIPDHAADLANAGLADELGASHG